MKLHNPFRTALVVTLGVGVGLALIQGFQSLVTVLLYVGTALFLSLGLDPVITWLTKRGLKRWLAVLITVVAVLAACAGIVSIVLPVIIAQLTQLIAEITRLASSISSIEDVKTWMHGVFPNLDVDLVVGEAQDWLLRNLGDITSQVVDVSLGIASGLIGAFIVIVLTIYLTASTPSLKAAVYQLVPASRRARFRDIAEQITDSVGYYVMGQLTLAAINGILSAIYLNIINAPFPAVLVVIAFCGSLIPLVGTLTGSTVIVLTCLIPGLASPATALAAGIWYLIYMQIEAYLLSPRIMSRAVSVPGAVVVIAALAGGVLGGLLGALVAIPVAASLLIIYRQVVIPRQSER